MTTCTTPFWLFAVASILAAAIPTAPAFGNQGVARKEVLILYGLQSHMPIVNAWDRSIRSAIRSGFEGSVRIETEYLDLLRTKDLDYVDQWLGLLQKKYIDKAPDVIIAVFDPGLRFVLDHREKLFPETPVVFCSAHFVQPTGVERTNLTGVLYELGYEETLELAKRICPATRRVAVIAGTSDYGNLMLKEAKSTFASNTDFEFRYLDGLSIERLLLEVERLPEDTIILFLVYVRDPDGNHHYASDVLAAISSRASVPTFSLWETGVRSGDIGGNKVRIEKQGQLAGELAVRVLGGEDPASIPFVGEGTNEFVFDWRELKRWSVNEENLPEGSIVLYRQNSFWQDYGVYISLAVVVILLQAGLIVGLITNLSKRRGAEHSLLEKREEARKLAGKLITAQEDERRRLAREIHDDFSQRLAALANQAGTLQDAPGGSELIRGSAETMRNELVSLADDMHQLSRQLHPSILDDLSLEDALRSECLSLSERNSIPIVFESRDVPDSLPVPTKLCVYRVTQEAAWNAIKHAKATRIKVRLVGDDEDLYLDVEDDGSGFVLGAVGWNSGLGLSSMEERVRLVEGEMTLKSASGKGTMIQVRIPLLEVSS